LESSLTENYFWFPEFAGAKFEGKIEKGEFVTINLESSSLEQSVNIEKVLKNHEIVIHGLHNSIPATFIVMLIYKKENFGFLNNNYLLVLNFRILFLYYGYHLIE
jgi:hypothetical protein